MSIRLAADVWVLVLVSNVETEIVDDVSGVLNDIGSLLQVAGGSITAEVLECGKVVGVGGSGQAREDALLGQEKGASANREDSSLSGGVSLLEIGKGRDQAKGLGVLGQDLLGVASKDDKNVKVVKALMGVLEGQLRTDHGSLSRENLGLGSSDGDFESLCVCCTWGKGRWVSQLMREKRMLTDDANGVV